MFNPCRLKLYVETQQSAFEVKQPVPCRCCHRGRKFRVESHLVDMASLQLCFPKSCLPRVIQYRLCLRIQALRWCRRKASNRMSRRSHQRRSKFNKMGQSTIYGGRSCRLHCDTKMSVGGESPYKHGWFSINRAVIYFSSLFIPYSLICSLIAVSVHP